MDQFLDSWHSYRFRYCSVNNLGYILKCFVLIDLKTSKITHQDVGQMDMYIRMYDEMKRNEGDNPTLGIAVPLPLMTNFCS